MTHTAAPGPGHDALAAELARVATLADPVPDDWRASASSSFAWMRVAGVPASLAYDSWAERTEPGGDRRPAGTVPREVVYSAESLAIELELDVGADSVRVVGRVLPGRRAGVVALWPEGRSETTCDDTGAFHFDELPRQPISIHVTGDLPVKTGWVTT